MTESPRPRRAAVLAGPGRKLWPLVALGCALSGTAPGDTPPVVDSQSIVRSLRTPAPLTRGLVVAPRTSAGSAAAGTPTEAAAGGQRKVTLDIRFANDSERLTSAAHAQLQQLGAALNSPELARSRFVIAGHTSATGSAAHNLRLSQARARAVRAYLLDRFQIAPDRIEATGYGSSRPLPDFPANALQQRRVEISALPGS
ncbi:MAG: OmpA family protein [Gammaproteobacteria bacterium]|nr:OmpA family protein [Gammaproteobacteria bacterium]